MIAVGEWLARDIGHAGIDRFQVGAGAVWTSRSIKFAAEFRFEELIRLLGFRATDAGVDTLTRFAQKANALVSRPGFHPSESAVDQAHGREAIKRRINPAIERNIGGTLIFGRVRTIATKDLADRSPRIAAQFRVVMPAVDILRDEIAENAADENIGRKMLAGSNSRVIHERSQTVRRDFHEWIRVLMRDHSGDGPGRARMLRRKGG